MECSPGGNDRISSLIRTPGAASVKVAVPTLCPDEFLISTTTGLGAGLAAAGATCIAPHAARKPTTSREVLFIGKTPFRYGRFCATLLLNRGHLKSTQQSADRGGISPL